MHCRETTIVVQQFHRKPALLGAYKTTLDGQTVSYTIKRSFRAKHARLEVRAETGLSVVIPCSYNRDDIPDLLRKKERWILDKLAKYVKENPITEGKEPKSGDFIIYLGRRLRVVTRRNPDTAVSIRLEKNRLLVNLNHQNGRLNLILEGWYRQQAKRLIKQNADELCLRLGATYSRLPVRGT